MQMVAGGKAGGANSADNIAFCNLLAFFTAEFFKMVMPAHNSAAVVKHNGIAGKAKPAGKNNGAAVGGINFLAAGRRHINGIVVFGISVGEGAEGAEGSGFSVCITAEGPHKFAFPKGSFCESEAVFLIEFIKSGAYCGIFQSFFKGGGFHGKILFSEGLILYGNGGGKFIVPALEGKVIVTRILGGFYRNETVPYPVFFKEGAFVTEGIGENAFGKIDVFRTYYNVASAKDIVGRKINCGLRNRLRFGLRFRDWFRFYYDLFCGRTF